MKKIGKAAGEAGTKLRDRSRSVKLRVLAIARASRNKTEKGQEKLKQSYVKLLEATSRVVGQAKKFSREIAERVKRGNRTVLSRAKKELDKMIPRVQQVMRQTRERVLEGNTRAEEKILSLFEPQTEVVRKGKAHKPNEFGKLVKIQEAEKQIITDYQVCEQRPADSTFWPEAKVNWRPYHLTRTPARLRPWSALPGTTCQTVWVRAGGSGGRSRILLRGE